MKQLELFDRCPVESVEAEPTTSDFPIDKRTNAQLIGRFVAEHGWLANENLNDGGPQHSEWDTVWPKVSAIMSKLSDISTCPCCGVLRLPPREPDLSKAPWSESCCCSDRITCLYHQYQVHEAPRRPEEHVLRARAEKEYENALKESEEIKQRFARVQLFLELTKKLPEFVLQELLVKWRKDIEIVETVRRPYRSEEETGDDK